MSASNRLAGDRPVPDLVTEVPGPKARAHVAFDETWTSPSLPRAYPIVPVRGDGLTVEDIDGNLFLDFAAGIAVNSTGHAHPAGRRRDQGAGGRADPLQRERLLPADLRRESASGSPRSRRSPAAGRGRISATPAPRSVEAAIKLARYATKRPYIVAFLGAFHGRTLRLGRADRLEGEVPRRVRAAAAGRLPRAVRQGRGPALVRRGPVRQARPGQRGRRDHRRADPGRGRLHRPRGRLPRGPARASATGTGSCSSPTRSSRAPAGPGRCGRSSTGASSPTSC